MHTVSLYSLFSGNLHDCLKFDREPSTIVDFRSQADYSTAGSD